MRSAHAAVHVAAAHAALGHVTHAAHSAAAHAAHAAAHHLAGELGNLLAVNGDGAAIQLAFAVEIERALRSEGAVC